MNITDLVLQCFYCTTLLGVIFMKRCFCECYANDSCTTTCSGVLGHRIDGVLRHRIAQQWALESHTRDSVKFWLWSIGAGDDARKKKQWQRKRNVQ
jgi:hypothetical protein